MHIANVLRFAGGVIATVVLVGAAHAQLFRAYLSPTGNDANNCTLATPCRLLPAALAAVADGGEIWMLDSANYNTATVNITKSVSILAIPGAVGSVVATGGPAINIGTVGVKVALRNLVITPLPATGATNGIVMFGGVSLTVDNCLIADLPGIGILVSTAVKVRIVDSLIRDNASHGVNLTSGPTADISGTRLLGNLMGVIVQGLSAGTTTTAAISDSILSGNSIGIDAVAPTVGASVYVSVRRSTVSNDGIGIISQGQGSALVTVSNNLVTRNNIGLLQAAPAILESQGDNTVRQNSTNTSGTITSAPGI